MFRSSIPRDIKSDFIDLIIEFGPQTKTKAGFVPKLSNDSFKVFVLIRPTSIFEFSDVFVFCDVTKYLVCRLSSEMFSKSFLNNNSSSVFAENKS